MTTPKEELEAFFTMFSGHLSAAKRDHLRGQLTKALASERAEGFSAAREKAAQTAESAEAKTMGMRVGLHIVAGRIRAMTDEGGES